MKLILAPDVYVNASVAAKSPPEQVVRRLIGPGKTPVACSNWILERVEAMLLAIPEFKKDAVAPQLATIRQFVKLVESDGKHGPNAWEEALLSTARAAGVERVVTDHPDLLAKEETGGVEFMSTEAWLVEQTTPPPAPGG